MLPGITPIYWWEGKVEEGTEAALIVKTRESLVDRVIDFVIQRHSYTCPCVVALPIVQGNPAFLACIGPPTRPP